MRKNGIGFFGLYLFLATIAGLSAADKWEAIGNVSGFVVSTMRDNHGNLWVGTEDRGVYRYDVAADQWIQFTRRDGLGDDNAYATACDKLGRVWVGHLNHGVSVFVPSPASSGERRGQGKWRNYDVIEGPIGERIFDIAVCPTDGDVWMATSAGLTRYSMSRESWSHYTRAHGLPSDQVQALAFDAQGNLYAGTQCDGLAIGSPFNDYKSWRTITGPERLPMTPDGAGLPTNLINDVLASRDGTVWVATTAGLAWSLNKGQTWSYLRGRDYADKVRGLAGGAPKLWKEPKPSVASELLPEDYVTCLAEDEAGLIWLGFRQQGYVALDPKTKHQVFRGTKVSEGLPDDYVTAIAASPDARPLLGTYGGGLARARAAFLPATRKSDALPASAKPMETVAGVRGSPPLPGPAKAPTLEEIALLLQECSRVVPLPTGQSFVVVLDDDWRTQGDWLGRYGRYWACLSAICSPLDYIWGAGSKPVEYFARTGTNCAQGDPYWVHWLYTQDRRSLEMPPIYFHSRVVKGLTTWQNARRQAEWDDHGEEYPMTQDGPHLYCSLKIPDGLFYLSLYDFNKDGHEGNNRYRDYAVSIRRHLGRTLADVDESPTQPPLARARIRDFWGGVHKRFLVRGPLKVTIELKRNYSFNTIWASVMLDSVEEYPEPYFGVTNPPPAASPSKNEPGLENADKLFDALEAVRARNPIGWATQRRRLYAPLLRLYARADQDDDRASLARLARCYYELGLFEQWEGCQRRIGCVPARDIEKALRWDGQTFSLSGKGREMITASLANLAKHKAEDRAGSSSPK